jgi:hypothetical protein
LRAARDPTPNFEHAAKNPNQHSRTCAKTIPPYHHNNAIMGRLHSKGKGISASAIPYSRAVPTWFKSSPEQVVENICKLAKKGATPSQIGVVLRDSHGVAQVKVVTGEITRNQNQGGVGAGELALTARRR